MDTIPKISFRSGSNISGFELVSLQELMSRPASPESHDSFKPHRLDFFAVLVLEGGPVNHVLDFESRVLRVGDSLVVAKNQIHAFDPQGNYEGYLVLFTEAFLLQHLASSTMAGISRLYNYHLNTSIYHSPQENQAFISNLQQELNHCPPTVLPQVVAAVLSIYLLKLETRNRALNLDYAFDRKYELFAQYKSLVETCYAQTRNVKDYAAQMSVSYKHLNQICKGFTHKTAKAFLDDHVILESKRLLASTTLSIAEICYQCGFEEPTNFLKYFKNLTGVTPSAFRQEFH